ncbi:MAG: carbamoyl phosphate synthase-like protein [Candidatus Kaiserbacteria bacterium]|nr:carbamoyl phosphate synthase-like protein [Candidatus Kaiserbacteria bacterium]
MPSKNKKYNILVTGVGGPAGINAVRLLQKYKKDFEVFGVDINPLSVGKKFSKHFDVCESVSSRQEYIKWMSSYITKNKIDIVLPTVAEELVLIEDVENKIKNEEVLFVVSNKRSLLLCDKKNELYDWMTSQFPDYIGPHQVLNKKLEWKAEEYFIKPITGRGSRGCRLVSRVELLWMMKNIDTTKTIAMEVLPGKEWTVDAYIRADGTFAYVVPRVRVSLSGGISLVGKTEKREDIIEMTKQVLSKLDCFGPVFIQWKENQYGIPKMVEINPRLSGGVTITALAGANPIKVLLDELGAKKTSVQWKELTVSRYFEDTII